MLVPVTTTVVSSDCSVLVVGSAGFGDAGCSCASALPLTIDAPVSAARTAARID
jgi:hypothetical protein